MSLSAVLDLAFDGPWWEDATMACLLTAGFGGTVLFIPAVWAGPAVADWVAADARWLADRCGRAGAWLAAWWQDVAASQSAVGGAFPFDYGRHRKVAVAPEAVAFPLRHAGPDDMPEVPGLAPDDDGVAVAA